MPTSLAADAITLAEWGVQNGLLPWQAFKLVCAGRARAWKTNGRWYLAREDADRLARELAASETHTVPTPQPA